MPTMVKLPRNPSVLRDFGPYPATLSLGQGTTSTQRKFCDGLHGFEPGTQATLLALVQRRTPRPVEFFDIGAHVGMHSLIISSVYPARSVRVTAFEPTPKTAAVCRALAGANDLEIRIERCAISDEDGTVSLFISPWETSNSLMQGFRPATDVVQVPSVKLDTYCAGRGVLPSVIKIDVESYESHVVNGAMRVLRQGRPSVLCEILRGTDPAAIGQTVGAFGSLGYHMYRWTRADSWRDCSPRDIVEQVPHDGNDWLFTPDAVDDRFRAVLATWRDAIAQCRADRTVRLPHDSRRRPAYYARRPLERLRPGHGQS
jgi:FkbM family methyltransferase